MQNSIDFLTQYAAVHTVPNTRKPIRLPPRHKILPRWCVTTAFRQRLALNIAVANLLLFFSLSNTLAATPIYKKKTIDGVMIFSDAPMQVEGGKFKRTRYKASYGRPVATASCFGMNRTKLAERAARYSTHINAAANKYQLDPNLIRAVAEVESCFDEKAVSVVGAQGLMQLMPKTAASLGVSNSFNPAQNIHGGAHYLSKMLKRYKQDQTLALAAYNAGPGAVDKYQGIPPYPETQAYVKKVLARYKPAP